MFPFTGRPGSKPAPVLAVKIDNVAPARPPTGLADADLVDVEPVEAGLSRLMAIFSSRLTETVGPIRSACETDLRLLRQFGEPALAFSGAQTKLLDVIADAPVHDVSPDAAGGAYFRSASRSAPHNLYASPRELWRRLRRRPGPRTSGCGSGRPRPADDRPTGSE